MTPLEQTLTDISAAIRQADYARASELSAVLETVSLPPDATTARRIARLAQENARLLAAAATGIRAAQRRIADLRTGRSLTTYDRAGLKHRHAAGTAATQRI